MLLAYNHLDELTDHHYRYCRISCEATLTSLLLAYNRLDELTGLELLSSLEILDIQVGS